MLNFQQHEQLCDKLGGLNVCSETKTLISGCHRRDTDPSLLPKCLKCVQRVIPYIQTSKLIWTQISNSAYHHFDFLLRNLNFWERRIVISWHASTSSFDLALINLLL